MDTKKVLQQLIKIANNQQKIINKLAQGTTWDQFNQHHGQTGAGGAANVGEIAGGSRPIMNTVRQLVPPGVSIYRATAGQDGAVVIDLKVSKDFKGNAAAQIRPNLMGKTIKADDGSDIKISDNQYKIQVTTNVG